MTSRTPRNKFVAHNSEAGISLMLAVLILSALTAIAFSIAAIVFIELRTSGDNLRTEPALYATLGVTEEALMQYKLRFSPSSLSDMNVPNCAPSIKNICTINNVTLQLPAPQPIPFDQSPLVQVVNPLEKINLPMYTPQSFTKLYGKLKITVLPTGGDDEVQVTITQTDLTGKKTPYVQVLDEFSPPFVYTDFQSDSQYDLELYNCGPNLASCNADDAVTVSIDTYDVDGTTVKGLPFIGQKVFKIIANYLGLTRSYIVKIPD